MKIAVSSRGRELSSMVDDRFGRAEYFVIMDTDTGEISAIDNAQNVTAAQGAGVQAAERIVNTGVRAVITGHCGPKAFRALSAAGVAVFTNAHGSVPSALAQFEAGKLREAHSADVESHWS
jgi:predicted Fe-Mo cluster-binding NifX family protein